MSPEFPAERRIDEESVKRALLEFIRRPRDDPEWQRHADDVGLTEDSLEGVLRKPDWAGDECWILGRWSLRWEKDRLKATLSRCLKYGHGITLNIYLQKQGDQFKVVDWDVMRLFGIEETG